MFKLFKPLFWLILNALCIAYPSLAQPTLWGMTTEGGPTGSGVIFKVKTNGADYSLVHAFEAEDGGGGAIGSQGMVLASDGLFYGATNRGGANDMGTIFSYDPLTHEYHKRIDFTEATGAYPFGALMQASNGKIYCTTQWEGANGYGTLLSYDITSNSLQVVYSWETGNGMANGSFGVIEGDDGILYGTRGNWGSARKGLIFSYNPVSQAYEERHHFIDDNEGRTPYGVLTKLDDGTFLGVTETGGINGYGTVYHFDPTSNAFTKTADVSGAASGAQNGAYPVGFLTKHSNGKFYGVTQSGGNVPNNSSIGTIFEYDHSTHSYTMKVSFYPTLGIRPSGKLVLGTDGKLYGKTNEGGALSDQGGTFFSYDPTINVFTKIKDFGGDFGTKPYGSLELEPNGKILMSTSEGGQGNGGVLLEYDPPSGDFEIVRSLNYAPDGAAPLGTFSKDPSGMLLATLSSGGRFGKGAIFQFDTNTKAFLNIANFDGANGKEPVGSLLLADNGNYYGMTRMGGDHNLGVIYQFNYSTKECVPVFHFDESSGSQPSGSLTKGLNGMLFGVATRDGDSEWGTAFTFNTLTNTFTKIHDFTPSTGAVPMGSLKWFSDNMLYGTTAEGGTDNSGTIYRIDPITGDYSKVYDFDSENGFQSVGDLLVTRSGNMYGLTSGGGEFNGGVLFQFIPASGEYNVLKSFNEASGMYPMGSLTEGAKGNLFGMTSSEGANGVGTLFSFNTLSGRLVLIKNFDYNNGASPAQNNLLLIQSDQLINFSPQALTFTAAQVKLTANSTSRLALVYESSDNTIASINGDMITMHRTGSVMITASQPGDIEYHPATPVQQLFTVKLANPMALSPSKVNRIGFTAMWTAVEGAQSYLLDVSTDNFLTFISNYQQKTIAGLEELVTDLLPGVNYQYRVIAVGEFENSEYSNIIELVTASPLATPVAMDATEITTTGFTAHWKEVSSATQYELDVSTDDFSTFVSGYQHKQIAGLEEIVTGLLPGVTYQYRIKAVGEFENSEFSNTIQLVTVSPITTPVAMSATEITTTGFTAHWKEVSSATQYELDVSTDDFSTFVSDYHDKRVAGLQERITGLLPGVSYQYRVKAVGQFGNSEYSNIIELVTASPLATPIVMDATDITTTGFVAHWKEVSSATQYELDVSADHFSTFVTSYHSMLVNALSKEISGLIPNTTYQYRLRAVNAEGISSSSEAKTVTTLNELINAVAAEGHQDEIFTYPNPANDFCYIVTAPDQDSMLRIVNAGGQVILQKEIHGTGEEIDIKSLSPGLYLIEVMHGRDRYITRLVKN